MSGKLQAPHPLVERLNSTMRFKSRETPVAFRAESTATKPLTNTVHSNQVLDSYTEVPEAKTSDDGKSLSSNQKDLALHPKGYVVEIENVQDVEIGGRPSQARSASTVYDSFGRASTTHSPRMAHYDASRDQGPITALRSAQDIQPEDKSTGKSPFGGLRNLSRMSSPDEIDTRTQKRPRTDQLIPHSSSALYDTSIGQSPRFLKQPETRPITPEQLVDEVKGIYAGLVMVEKKCVEIDQQQSSTTNKLTNEQWQALIALHRTLLHEHHDFFLASQHPSANPNLRCLAAKYAMPARMWRHGIHSFLDLLRHRLPDSLDHMFAFVYLAYSMMALLMESVPSFDETWIECLGDLARYRMAIEEADLKDREVWSGVAKMWYNKASVKSPDVGRIQHHLTVLARSNNVQQFFYYSKALLSGTPLGGSTNSIGTLPNVDISPKHHHANGRAQIHKHFSLGDISAGRIGITYEPHSPNPERDARIGCRLRLFFLAIAANTFNIFQNFGHIYGTHWAQLVKSGLYSEDVLTVRLLFRPARASLDSILYWARCTLSAFTRHPSLSTKVCLLMSTLPIAHAAPVGAPPPTGNLGRPEAWLNFETICHIIGWVSTCTLGAFIIYLGFRNPRRDLARDHVLSFGSAGASLVLLDPRAAPEVRWATLVVGVVFLVRLWAKVITLYEMGHGWLGPIFGIGILIDTGLVHLTVGAAGGDQGLFFQLLLASFCLSLSLCASMARFHRHIYTPNPSALPTHIRQ